MPALVQVLGTSAVTGCEGLDGVGNKLKHQMSSDADGRIVVVLCENSLLVEKNTDVWPPRAKLDQLRLHN